MIGHDAEMHFTLASDEQLNELLIGRRAGSSIPWSRIAVATRVPAGSTGVVWRGSDFHYDPLKPLLLVSREEDHRRLFGRIAHLRSELTPITAWCHLMTPQSFERLDSLTREPDLGGNEAAWTGAIVAEAVLLTERPFSKLRVPTCLATQGFGIARAHALWGSSPDAVLTQFDSARQVFRTTEPKLTKVRSALRPVWSALSYLAKGSVAGIPRELGSIVSALRALRNERNRSGHEGNVELIAQFANSIPEGEDIHNLAALSPELRLRTFDTLVRALDSASELDIARRSGLAMLAGYLATVAAGGYASLGLTEETSQRHPEITAWAYVIGGIGEGVVWTSGFDGLGRLIARELTRPFRLDESPTCDIAADEAKLLVDQQLSDPFVHLRLKQSRVLSIALLPGVNVAVPMPGQSLEETRPTRMDTSTEAAQTSGQSPFAILADALWPFLQKRLESVARPREASRDFEQTESAKKNRGRRKGPQSNLW